MVLPFFYIDDLSANLLALNEDTSRHMIGVLRMTKGETVLLTDGKGGKAKAVIVDDDRKRCTVRVQSIETEEERKPGVSVAVSLIKNASRFEWFLEKAAEIGVAEIIPLRCERTEKSTFRHDRMQNILVSAMLQSQQTRLPVLQQPTGFDDLVKSPSQNQKFIAHCLPQEKRPLTRQLINPSTGQLVLIGPEGDFTEKEIGLALENGFTPVALGNTRLRTETAAMVAAALLKMM